MIIDDKDTARLLLEELKHLGFTGVVEQIGKHKVRNWVKTIGTKKMTIYPNRVQITDGETVYQEFRCSTVGELLEIIAMYEDLERHGLDYQEEAPKRTRKHWKFW